MYSTRSNITSTTLLLLNSTNNKPSEVSLHALIPPRPRRPQRLTGVEGVKTREVSEVISRWVCCGC